MDFNKWSRDGIPYVTAETAEILLHKFAKTQKEAREKAEAQDKEPINFQSRRRVELRRTADIDFTARCMASLREWLDSSNPLAHRRHRHEGHGPEGEQPEGVSFLLPPCNAFLRRALYESIQKEYPSLTLEKVGSANQIRVLRLSPEEKQARDKRLLRESWEDLIVQKIGMWRVFQGLSLACQGLSIPMDSITFARNVQDVNWHKGTQEDLCKHNRKIPIIVHNGFLDLHFLMTHFHAHQLPTTYPEAKALIHSYFPIVYDTKFLSSECMPPNNVIEPTHLENLFIKIVRDVPEMNNRILLAADQPIGNDEQTHEAAYDAYMTGAVYVGICRYINDWKHYRGSDDQNLLTNMGGGVGTLTHILVAENDNQVKSLFGRNMVRFLFKTFNTNSGGLDRSFIFVLVAFLGSVISDDDNVHHGYGES